MSQDLHAQIHKIPGFGKLPAQTCDALLSRAVEKNYQAGQIIYLQGELADSLYILLGGWLKSSRMTKDGREQGMLFLKPVNVFGLVSVFTKKPYPATTTALDDVETLVLKAADFVELVQTHMPLSLAVIDNLCQRNLHFIDLIEDLSLHNVETRLASSLMKNAVVTGDETYVLRQNWTTFDEMAVRLGTVRDVLSRALKALEKEGLIEVTRQKIIILDPQKLRQRGGDCLPD